jgi:hypothetical protein
VTPPRKPTVGYGPEETTPTPQAFVDAETAARIASDKAKIERASHERECPMARRLDQIEADLRAAAQERTTMIKKISYMDGAAQQAARSAGFRAAVYTTLAVVLVNVAIWAANRIWPMAHAQTRTTTAQVEK